ncbi:MAG: ANTAR domain-containing protein [Terrabacter sp.]
MSDQQPGDDWQHQLDELRATVSTNRADIDALQDEAKQAHDRADASEARSQEARRRAEDQETRADANHDRIGQLEERVDISQKLIAELQAEGLVTLEHAAHLEEALTASRVIGAAIGIIMAYRKVSETDAFSVLVSASQNTNRKLRVLAAEIVDTGDVSQLPNP